MPGGKRNEEGIDWELGVGRGKLEYMEWINDQSYCTAQGTIFSILIHRNGKEYEKIYMYY